jgi:DICT domain-containing protein
VRRVARARDSGVSLTKAIADVRAYAAPESVYAELRRAHPDLPVMRVRKRTLLALTRALEDECCARAQRPLLVGTFQHERFLRQARRRWRELARTARRTVVFAELDAGAPAPEGVEVVPLPPDSVLGREWTVLCLAEDMAAVLTAFELPGQDAGDDADRRFEAVWSLERSVVQDAAAVALAIAGSDPAEAAAVGLTADAARSEGLARAGATLARAMGYLDDSR